jgi:hypothetical protein
MAWSRFSALFGTIAFVSAFTGTAQAAVYTEDFEGTFPAWESNWFGTLSSGRNFYCNGALGCNDRGNSPDGLWIVGTAGGGSNPVEVVFESTFGASLVSLSLDIAGFYATQLQAFDSHNVMIFDQAVTLTSGAFTDPGVYSNYTITSATGISRFTFSGAASGNTSIDNLVAITGSVPEPESLALLAAGLVVAGSAVARRRMA